MANQINTAAEFLYSVQDTSTNGPTAVYGGPCLLRGIFVNTTLSAHTVVLKDNTTAIFTLPASSGAGTWFECGDARIETSLNIDPDDSSTGNVTVVYKPFHDGLAG